MFFSHCLTNGGDDFLNIRFCRNSNLHHHQPFFTLNLNGKGCATLNRNAGWLRSEVSSMS